MLCLYECAHTYILIDTHALLSYSLCVFIKWFSNSWIHLKFTVTFTLMNLQHWLISALDFHSSPREKTRVLLHHVTARIVTLLQVNFTVDLFKNDYRNLFTGLSMKYLLLASLIASCAGFNKEQNFVDIVVAVKQFFYSGCVYILHDDDLGKFKWLKMPF